jgi:Ca2+-binding EF-hand superfamily protein
MATEIFEKMDEDGSKTITKEEAIEYWKNNFAKINATEFFKHVDVNNDGSITYEEWLEFWRTVKAEGHTDEEIREELHSLKEKEVWVGFN